MGKIFLNKKELLRKFCDRFLKHKMFTLQISRTKEKTWVIQDGKLVTILILKGFIK